MWTTDDLSSEEKDKMCALVRYINYAQLGFDLDNHDISSGDDDFLEMLELVSNCPKGIYFKPFEDVDGTPKPVGCFTSDEIVSYLFNKVELWKWKIVWLQYHKGILTSMEGTKFDLVYITLQPR